jgi:pimeloyl-ACP methyl ester carboxylesterase
MPYIEAGQSKLYYEEYGEGFPVLLVHGVGGNHASWFRQIPALREVCRAITIDHRAFGNSTDVEGLGRSAFVDDIGLMLDALGIEKAVLVGQSMGGGSLAAYACRHPERVEALVHCDSLAAVVLDEPHASRLKALNAATADYPQTRRVLGATTLASDPERTLLYLQLASFNSVNLKTVKGQPTPWTPHELAAAGVPVLFVAGEEDVICTPDLIHVMHQQVPGSEYAEVPLAGHSAYFEQAETFNRILIDYLVRRGVAKRVAA